MIAIEGSTTTLTCSLQGASFQWYKLTNSGWSLLQQGAKYGNVNTGYLAIYNVDPHDGGTYSCTNGINLFMTIFFRGTQHKLEKCSQTKPINVHCICIKLKLVKNFRKNKILTVILLVCNLSVICNFTQHSTDAM